MIKPICGYKQNLKYFNPILLQKLGTEAGLILNALVTISSSKYSGSQGEFECTDEEIKNYSAIEDNSGFLARLCNESLITIKMMGEPKHRFFILNSDKIESLINPNQSEVKDKAKDFLNLGKKAKTKPQTKFQKFYSLAKEKFCDADLLDSIYKYLEAKISQLTLEQWMMCLKHLSELSLTYSADLRKKALISIVEKSIAGGWFDFYRINEYELQKADQTSFNQFGEYVKPISKSDSKNTVPNLAKGDNGEHISF